MAKPFLRINLSESGLFFRPVALEPGCPLFDPTNANDKILFRWFGGMTPEPEWDELEEKIAFYIRNDQGARVEEVTCQPVTNKELDEELITEIDRLQQRFDRIRPGSTTEKILHEKLSQEFHDLIENKSRPDRTYYFFKYQDAAGLWRLIWICGYQPLHQEFGTPMICDDEACNELYIRLPGKKAICPVCLKVPSAQRKAREAAKRRRKRFLMALLLLLLLLWVIWNQFTLRVTPGPWTGYVGTVADFKVKTPGIDGFGWFLSKDVTQEVLRQVEDPTIAHFMGDSQRALAMSPGETKITFYTGLRWKTILVTVRPPVNPQRVWLEPESPELAVGSVTRLRMMGEYEDGLTAELSDSTAWTSKNDGTVYHYNGFLEGLKDGATTVEARYRATAKDPWMPATANVTVTAKNMEKLTLAVLSGGETLPPGKKLPVKLTGTDAEGKTYDFAGSSRVKWTVDPPALLKIGGETLTTVQNGTGRLQAELLDGSPAGATLLTADMTAVVEPKAARFQKLRVAPKELNMACDQKLALSVISPDDSQLRITSSNPKVVEIDRARNLIGRNPGTAEITVACGDAVETVAVTVTAIQPDAIFLRNPVATVPVDHDAALTVVARAGSERYYELVSDAVKVESAPSVKFAGVDRAQLKVKGYDPTVADHPQKIAVVHRGQSVSAPVRVIPAPLRLMITPAGKVELPLGLCMTFDGNAVYGDGVRTLVPYTRMEWMTDPLPEDVNGFDFQRGKAMALDVGAGPVNIWGKYFGQESNRAELVTTERADVTLAIEVDRNLRIKDEMGVALLTGKTAQGDVELVPGIGQFTSENTDVIGVTNDKAGVYKAVNPGVATLSATHPAAENPAATDLRVVHGRNARMVWEPADVRLAVDEVVPFRLMLEGRNPEAAEGEESLWTVEMNSPGVYYHFARPDAVNWQAPQLTGVQESAPFEVSASYQPYLKGLAKATVEVFRAQPPETLRVVPAEVTLAPGQSLALEVQEQLEGGAEFAEVQPEAVTWEVPRNVYWTPPFGVLRPVAEVPLENAESFTLRAKYRGKTADCRVNVGTQTLSPSDPEVELFVRRQPGGKLLPEGRAQQYSVWMRKGDLEEPAPDVRFTPDFENDYLAWEAPTVYALKAGYTHWFQAKVGDRAVRWYVQTVNPFVPGEAAPLPDGAPSEVRLLSNSGEEVEMAVGSRYVDYRVEAEWPDGTVRFVTNDAVLHPMDGDKSIVSPQNKQLLGLKPGKVTFIAEYMGVDSVDPKLTITVTPEIEADALKLEPTRDIRMIPGDTVQFNVHGYKAGKSVGLLPLSDAVVWKSTNEGVAKPQGSQTLGVAVGTAGITAEMLGMTTPPAGVQVVATIEERYGPTTNLIPMFVGESKYVGKDFQIIRGNVDYSMNCNVTPLVPGICTYDAARHALVAVAPGATDVMFTTGDKVAKMRVVVDGVDAETLAKVRDGDVVVEPAVTTISAGQVADLRVYAVSKDGSVRLERTASAIFTSADPSVCEVRGLQVGGMKTGGPVKITARIPETGTRTGESQVTVDANPITELVAEPAAMKMSVGDRAHLFISGRSLSGLRPMFAHPDLRVTAEGGAVQMQGINNVEAVQAGTSQIQIDWKAGQAKRTVSAEVDASAYTSLTIDPPETTIGVGEGRAYQVTALRNGRIYVLTAADGLQLSATDPNVAATQDNMVYGKSVGRTGVVARFAGLTTEAAVNVVEAGTITAVPPEDIETGLTYLPPVEPGRTITTLGPGVVGPREDWTTTGGGGTTTTETYNDGPIALRFEPSTMRIAKSGGDVVVRVYEEADFGRLGRDVSADPNLQVTSGSTLITVARGEDGLYRITPTGKDGQTRVNAKLGALEAIPMFVQVGDYPTEAASLIVSPNPLQMTIGEVTSLDAVRVQPEQGVMPFDVAYRLTVLDEGGGVVAVDGQNIRALKPGSAQVRVSSVDAQGKYDAMSAYLQVQVTQPLKLAMTPMDHTMRVGELTPSFVVMATDATGSTFQVPAELMSTDPNILQADVSDPTRFRAVSLGTTQIRASHNGTDIYATVSVGGDRFMNVEGQLSEGPTSFNVMLTVSANTDSGALEYRVYEAGQTPPESWIAGQASAEGQNVMLPGPQMSYNPNRNHQYTLVVESRTAGGGEPQKYMYNFRLAGIIEKVN